MIKVKISCSIFLHLFISSAPYSILLVKTMILSSRRFIWHPICFVYDWIMSSVIDVICHLCHSMTYDRCRMSTSSMPIWVSNEPSGAQEYSFHKKNVAGCNRNKWIKEIGTADFFHYYFEISFVFTKMGGIWSKWGLILTTFFFWVHIANTQHPLLCIWI